MPAPASAASTAACDPAGPTGSDGQTATALNGRLTGKLAHSITAYQVSCARVIVTRVKNRGMARRAATIAITTTIVESDIRNLTYGDRDSVGLYQQRPSTGWGTVEQIMNPVYATDSFLNKMLRVRPGTWMTDPIGEVCQAVQISGTPDAYQPQARDGDIISGVLWNQQARSPGGSVGDVSGDGHSDLLGFKPDGTLWYYPNNMDSNAGGVPFVAGKQIGKGWQDFDRAVSADVSGDGHADVVATKPDGTMWWYPNNMDSNAGGVPFVDGKLVGPGWRDFNRFVAADVSGDGHADILATKPDGTMWYYPNNMDSNAGGVPFVKGDQIGRGWQDFDRMVAADVSGDGHADIVATKPDGTLWWYPNNMDSNAGGLPFVGGKQTGQGWQDLDRLVAADVSGDGHADIVATKPDGTLWYYPNNMDSNAGGVPFIGTEQIGKGWQIYSRIA
ncbi:FG-GAP-like repeat-containing protein [Micromonospora sp. NPDC005215]|uniref:FG-GAP-like repeat-containing protein n=1 Tax=Micromonospora sp. NPDC005215 TaxID=3157024 RepID=UPI0033AC3683